MVTAKQTTAFFKCLASIGYPADLIWQEKRRREATKREKHLLQQMEELRAENTQLQEANNHLSAVRVLYFYDSVIDWSSFQQLGKRRRATSSNQPPYKCRRRGRVQAPATPATMTTSTTQTSSLTDTTTMNSNEPAPAPSHPPVTLVQSFSYLGWGGFTTQ